MLIQLHERGRLTVDQIKYYLMENAEWQNKFQQWAVAGVTPIQDSATAKVLTLVDIQAQTMDEISERKPRFGENLDLPLPQPQPEKPLH